MIRLRLTELESAVRRAIGMLRGGKHGAAFPPAVLELLALAAGCERATYWSVDPKLMRLCATATWSAAGTCTPADCASHPRTTSLSLSNAGRVWRTRKPLWSTSLLQEATSSVAFGMGLRGGVWFAVKSDTTVYGVIELLERALESGTSEELCVVERLGVRLGHVLEELRYQSAPASSGDFTDGG